METPLDGHAQEVLDSENVAEPNHLEVAGVSWLSGSNVGLPSGSPAFESDRRTEISSYGLSDLNQFYHIGTHNTAVGEMITPA